MQFRRGLQERQPVSPLPDAFAHIENNVREKGSLFSGRGIGGGSAKEKKERFRNTARSLLLDSGSAPGGCNRVVRIGSRPERRCV